MGLRPISPMASGALTEGGLGYGAVSPAPWEGEEGGWHGAVQGWFSVDAQFWLTISLIAGFDGELGTIGFGARARILERDAYVLGAGLEVGSGWVALEVPFAVRIVDELWAYTGPSGGTWGAEPALRLPLGLDGHLPEAFRLRGEGQLSLPGFDPDLRRFHLGAGLARQQ